MQKKRREDEKNPKVAWVLPSGLSYSLKVLIKTFFDVYEGPLGGVGVRSGSGAPHRIFKSNQSLPSLSNQVG